MMLTPEIIVGRVPGRDVVIRIDELLIMVMFFTWLVKTAINHEMGLLVKTPLNKIMFYLIGIWVFSTSIGIIRGTVHPVKGVFYVLRYIEYFMLYFLAVNNIKSRKQMKTLIMAGLITSVIVVGYGYTQIGSGERLTAPFDFVGAHPEPATLGGYFLILMSLFLAFFINSNSISARILTGGVFCLMVSPFLYTLSRGSWIAFPGMVLSIFLLIKRRRIMLIVIILLAVVMAPIIFPKAVYDRVQYTFSRKIATYQIGSVRLEPSAAARVHTWTDTLIEFQRRPIIGHGVSGVSLKDAQIPLVIGETGVIGLFLFMWLLITIFKVGLKIYRTEKDNYFRSVALGYLAGFIALLFHSLSASTFIVIRIMEPFWILTAILVMLPKLHEDVLELNLKAD